jgi:hypothetical protein
MGDHVVTSEADIFELRRMAVLLADHGALTVKVLEAAGISRQQLQK